jgi:hypothetical protein
MLLPNWTEASLSRDFKADTNLFARCVTKGGGTVDAVQHAEMPIHEHVATHCSSPCTADGQVDASFGYFGVPAGTARTCLPVEVELQVQVVQVAEHLAAAATAVSTVTHQSRTAC